MSHVSRSTRRGRTLSAWAVVTALGLTTGLAACSDDSLPEDLGKRPSPSTSQPAPAAGAPNVLLITADDMSVDDIAHMPALQSLIADQGVTLTDGLAPTPLCVPARASLLTGQYAVNHGARTIKGRTGGPKALRKPQRTLPVWLQSAGYDTLFVGKYLNGYGLNRPKQIPAGWSDWRASIDDSTYSFTETEFNANGRIVKPEGYNTDIIADMSREALESRDAERPFYMWVNYVAPHIGGPRESDDPSVVFGDDPDAQLSTTMPAEKYRNKFADQELPDVPEMWRGTRGSHWYLPEHSSNYKAAMREVNQQRLESLLSVDDAIANTVAELEDQGILDETYVIVTSDNGFMVGHNNRMGKVLPYDNSLRIPILMRGPGLPRGTTSDLPVTNPDLAATIAAIAGAKPNRPIDGTDVLSLLQEQKSGKRPIPISAWPVKGGRIPMYTGIRYGSYTYVLPTHGPEELYDRSVDPGESRNLARQPRYRDLLKRLRAWEAEYRDCAGDACPKEYELS
ncbi:sulfatase-like hydrolase/transferase [Nocardioides dubius]|uniref:Sulfatase n=1 Tax=Nocardioides dubius TaxID=317019 RepID=A0ABN1TUQ9_9ACTN